MLSNKKIEDICSKYGMSCLILEDRVFVRTNRSEWFFYRLPESNIKLFHNNYYKRSSSEKFINSFHVQKKRFGSQEEIFEYIYNHDLKAYNRPIRKCRMELLFEKIEKTSAFNI